VAALNPFWAKTAPAASMILSFVGNGVFLADIWFPNFKQSIDLTVENLAQRTIPKPLTFWTDKVIPFMDFLNPLDPPSPPRPLLPTESKLVFPPNDLLQDLH
jgi:hypothetical protein